MVRQVVTPDLHFLVLEAMTKVGIPVPLISAKLLAQSSILEGKAVSLQVYVVLPPSDASPQPAVLPESASLR